MVPDDVVERHLAYLRQRGRSPGTLYARRRAIARMSALIDRPLLEASAADLARWREQLRVIDNTAVHYASHARGFFGWCQAAGMIDRNPADALALPPLVRGLPRPISEEDLMTAMAMAPPQIRPWLVLAGWMGLRAKEIAYLRRENVLDGRRPPAVLVASDATKGRHERIVPMNTWVRRELQAAGLAKAGFVFRRLDGRPGPNRPAVVSHRANRFLADLGISATLHQLRHRFATEAYRLTKDIRRVQEWLGHRDPATTAVYIELVQDEGAEMLEGLPVPPMLRAVGE
jgi:integrase